MLFLKRLVKLSVKKKKEPEEQLGELEMQTRYIAALREQNRSLRALREELAHAGL